MTTPDRSTTAVPAGAVYHPLSDTPWEDPGDAPAELRELAEQAAEVGARRAQVTTGAIGLYTQLSEMPARYEVPPHRHSAHELMVVLDGGCTIADGTVLTAGDMAEIPAGTEYGFTVNDDGMRFIVVRPSESHTHISTQEE